MNRMIEWMSELSDLQLWLVFGLLIVIASAALQLAYSGLTLHDVVEAGKTAVESGQDGQDRREAPPSEPSDTEVREPAREAEGASS